MGANFDQQEAISGSCGGMYRTYLSMLNYRMGSKARNHHKKNLDFSLSEIYPYGEASVWPSPTNRAQSLILSEADHIWDEDDVKALSDAYA